MNSLCAALHSVHYLTQYFAFWDFHSTPSQRVELHDSEKPYRTVYLGFKFNLVLAAWPAFKRPVRTFPQVLLLYVSISNSALADQEFKSKTWDLCWWFGCRDYRTCGKTPEIILLLTVPPNSPRCWRGSAQLLPQQEVEQTLLVFQPSSGD